MIKYLINRPVAVLMSFLAAIILGGITYFALPVSLLPDIAIPEISIQVSADQLSARQIENTIVKPLRRSLLQVAHRRDIQSQTRDGGAIIRLFFDYGTDTDYTFIEVNEKIDQAMNSLPKEIARPRVIKASATDIPVFNLNLTLKEDAPFEQSQEGRFLELSEFATSVIKRRIEQLPEVAMVDGTGIQTSELRIVPDLEKLASASLSYGDIENILSSNNIEPGSMNVRDGYYQYSVKFTSLLRTPQDIENIYIEKNSKIFQLKDLAKVYVAPQRTKGLAFYNGKQAVVFSVIKQSDASIEGLKTSVTDAIDRLTKQYPDIEFSISQNQTELLDYTLSNLQSNLLQGFILICIISLLFFRDWRTPAIISIGMVVSLVISMLFYYLFGMSLNIISLSGLILALGMMIDSSIIVTDNISQYREKDGLLDSACIRGTNEIIRPLLSSSLTTVAVFVPLVFISGIAGAIFYDQALSVSIGLGVSYIVAIIFLPVLYNLFYGNKFIDKIQLPHFLRKWLESVNNIGGMKLYDKGVDFVFRHRKLTLLSTLVVILLSSVMFSVIEKRKMPFLDHSESIISIDWGENITLAQNKQRTISLLQSIRGEVLQSSALIGEQQFLLQKSSQISSSESQLYLKAEDTKAITAIEQEVLNIIEKDYPQARVRLSPPENIFEKIFTSTEAEFTANISHIASDMSANIDSLLIFTQRVESATNGKTDMQLDKQINLSIDKQALMLYDVDYQNVHTSLVTIFGENNISILRSTGQYLPIVLGQDDKSIQEKLDHTLVSTRNGIRVPLSSFVRTSFGADFKTIYAGENGEYVPIHYKDVKDVDALTREITEIADESKLFDVAFSGSIFSNEKMFSELLFVLMISVLLLYFILAAQFESLVQPLIVLIELPIDISAALLVLWLCGNSLNIMSAIGIVVSCGIIINDSILKIDVMNSLRRDGMPILEAIHTAGHRRLRAIVMTSLTTILALVPMLFSKDMGSELQTPLALSLIGGMTIGTLVSLFVIPLIYWYIYKKSTAENK